MFKDTITYENFDGEKVTEDLYFNLTRAQVFELEKSIPGGFIAKLRDTEEKIRSYTENDNNVDAMYEMMNIIKIIVEASYGQKSADGKRFIKSKEDTDAFIQSEAYSEFLFSLVSDDSSKFQRFIMGVIPNIDQNALKQAVKEEAARLGQPELANMINSGNNNN